MSTGVDGGLHGVTDTWRLVAAERAALVADLEQLDADGWRTPSLCAGLDVEEVVAHLTAGASSGPVRWLAGLARCRFDVDRMVDMRLREQLGGTPEETLRRFRGVVGSRTAPSGHVDGWLGEAVVHGEDVRRPLGISYDYAPAALERVARFYAGRDFTVPSKRRAAGLRLEATDGPSRRGRGRSCGAAPSTWCSRWPAGPSRSTTSTARVCRSSRPEW